MFISQYTILEDFTFVYLSLLYTWPFRKMYLHSVSRPHARDVGCVDRIFCLGTKILRWNIIFERPYKCILFQIITVICKYSVEKIKFLVGVFHKKIRCFLCLLFLCVYIYLSIYYIICPCSFVSLTKKPVNISKYTFKTYVKR